MVVISRKYIYKNNLGTLIKKYRLENGLSIKELSLLANKKQRYIYELENYLEKGPSLDIMIKISNVLNVSIYEFINKDVNEKDILRWLDKKEMRK